ncbi:unnamed protein product [Adineta steineri]|uniref:Rho GTPase activating protein n=2 Tax=Adineta steineri TaxID=433720 RepID=A0A814QD82_9BILA|nr:unnamed protein product [Adineta steineri]
MSKSKEGWLKIKLHNQIKWHRRYCIIDWDKAILFTASRADTRYRDWIRLSPNIIINDCDTSSINNDINNNNLSISITETITNNVTATHLLQTETKNDYDSWLLALKQRAYSQIGGGIFGQSLENTYKYAPDKSSLVPLIVRQCCEYLLEHGSTFVGLFRVPGKQSAIKELRDMYDRGLSIELKQCYSPATISSLLKIYLQSLPESIIPTKCFDDFLEIGSRFKYNQTNDLNRLKQLIETNLSNINYATLAYLCLFLKKLTDHVEITKMDTDNLAVVFGNNLIRPVEDLDLNMIKGHNYNLLPLIKVLIDHSEYLFSVNQSNDTTYEQKTESVTKSSGFSSFSSLLSANDHHVTANSRSSSMPSILMETFSSYDSRNSSLENSTDMNNVKQRKISFTEKPTDYTTDHFNKRRTYLDTNQNQINTRPKRYGSIDLLDIKKDEHNVKHNQRSLDDIIVQQRQKTDNTSRPISIIDPPMTIRKMEKMPVKRGLANKFNKSFFSFKSTMSKALQTSHTSSSNENESQTIDSPSSTSQSESKTFDYQLSNNSSLKQLQNDVDILKELLEQKELTILELRKNSYEERLQFDHEKLELNQKIEQLQNQNIQLQKQLNMQ